jgi:hypothetical protein
VNTELHGVILDTLKFVECIRETGFRPLNSRFTRQSELDRLLATEPNTEEEVEINSNELQSISDVDKLFRDYVPPPITLQEHDLVAIAQIRKQHASAKNFTDKEVVNNCLIWYRNHLIKKHNLGTCWSRSQEKKYTKKGTISQNMYGQIFLEKSLVKTVQRRSTKSSRFGMTFFHW